MTSRSILAVIVTIALAALALRVTGAAWGRPYGYHPDEPFLLKPALRIVATGDYNPHFFRYPSALIYTEAFIVSLWHEHAQMPLDVPRGLGVGPFDTGTWTWPALYTGRLTVAVLGALSVLLAGVLGLRIGGAAAGVLSALFLAVLPLHVEHCRYLTTDVPEATALLLAFLFAGRLRPSHLNQALAGVCLGLAVATKYTALAAAPGLLAVAAWPRPERSLRVALLIGSAAVVSFLALCPFVVLDWHSFVNDIAVVQAHYRGGHIGAEGQWNWTWYVERLSQSGLGPVGLGLLAAGMAGLAWRLGARRGRACKSAQAGGAREATIMLLVALAWFGWLGSVKVRFERNLLPLLVLAVPACSAGISFACGRLHGRARRMIAYGLVGIALLFPAMITVAATLRFAGADTRNQALEWIGSNVPALARIVREEYTPRPDPRRYRVDYLWSLAAHDRQWYAEKGVDYLVASSAVYGRFLHAGAEGSPGTAARYRQLLGLPKAASFAPDERTRGPVITIYRLSPPAAPVRRKP